MLPLLLLTDGDTLVFIDPAPQDRSKNNLLTPTVPHRVHSEKLLATGSSYLLRLFSPRCQSQVRKRRGYTNGLPSGINYVIDLTPPTVDEDAIIFLTEVSCPMAIRTWAFRQGEWDLPPSCVGGEDELEVLPDIPESPTGNRNTTLAADEDSTADSSTLEAEDEGVFLALGADPQRRSQLRRPARTALPIEYSAKRHREGIEHILHVLEGLNATLDTPCKMWTFFAVAKLLDVAKVPAVKGYIMSWFYHSTNIRFIEIHPEISYRVSCGIKVSALCADSFVGLVGDEALLYIMREARLTPPRSWAPILDHSRIADFLDDTDVQRIEYASKSFAGTIIGDFLFLTGFDMPWLAQIVEYGRLTQHMEDFPEDKGLVLELEGLLKDYIRERIYRVLCHARDPRRSCNVPAPSDHDSHMSQLNRPSVIRIIGRHFWCDLLSVDIESSILGPFEPYHQSIADIGNGITAFAGHELASIRSVPRYSVEQKVREFNMQVRRQLSQILFHPSRRSALGANRSHLSNPSFNTSRPFQGTEPAVSTDDGHNKSFTINLRYPQRSQPAVNSTQTERQLYLPYRPLLQPSSDENHIPERTSEELTSALQGSVPGTTSTKVNAEERSFDLDLFLSSARALIVEISRTLLYPHGEATAALEATETLFSLTNNQFRFLPLWAGGNDDGSGGVFIDQNIPVMETGGFSAPGPAVHTGSVASTCTDNSLSEIDPDDSLSTVQGASHHATYSHISDLLSVDSFEEVSREHHDGPVQTQSPASSAPASTILFDDEYEFDVLSDGGSTVVMGSGRLSDIDDNEEFDIDMEHSDIDNDDNDDHDDDLHESHDDSFELVDSP
ncbi:uncharacterized protein N7496_007554 [Penicillium cataractarum]|uniref:Uncharacterized protein n=1 Tax=Penicillium cataractarum TaxID=2100454 RepID=A0A9W9S4E4_9EURO|nr:uncharacterized protein N7496_007554 [Penicillium cataractarum]KAJ5371462.1 hypothetical protein N7496_007554 [Penicillium cataractarum]